jgi:hypothetical protein
VDGQPVGQELDGVHGDVAHDHVHHPRGGLRAALARVAQVGHRELDLRVEPLAVVVEDVAQLDVHLKQRAGEGDLLGAEARRLRGLERQQPCNPTQLGYQ